MKIAPKLSLAAFALALAGCATPQTPGKSSSSAQPKPITSTRTSAQQAPKLAPQSATNTVLDRTIARTEDVFAWKEAVRKGSIVELEVTTQTWQNIVWKHRVEIVRPAKNEFPNCALLVIGFGRGSQRETFFAQLAANALGATLVNAWNVPNQPLFDKREDDLIAHTFSKYLESGDSSWPLLLPMTKSATQIMRAVNQWSRQETAKAPDETVQLLNKWVVSGASKRGWTTWLTAAAVNSASFQTAYKNEELQVSGIIPMVYDNLNLARQMPHQIASWGAYSEQIKDYARRGLPDLVGSEKGRALVQIVDPFVYRDRLKMPRLIINASNDPYWPLDSFNLYRRELLGRTDLFIAPNSGHVLNGNEAKVAGITVAWFRALARGQALPDLDAEVDLKAGAQNARGVWKLNVSSKMQTPQIKAARVWFATSTSRDFRQSKWQSLPLTNPKMLDNSRTFSFDVNEFSAKLNSKKGEYLTAFGEIELQSDLAGQSGGLNLNLPFLLSSPVTIWEN